MTYLKLAGAALVIISSSLLGICFGEDVKKRIVLLQEFRNLLCIVRSGIEYNRQLLPDLLEDAAALVEGEASILARTASELLMGDEKIRFYEAWKIAVEEAYAGSVWEKEPDLFYEAGKVMGFMDVKLRISGIDATLATIDEKLQKERSMSGEKCRLRRNLGFLMGLFITIVFI